MTTHFKVVNETYDADTETFGWPDRDVGVMVSRRDGDIQKNVSRVETISRLRRSRLQPDSFSYSARISCTVACNGLIFLLKFCKTLFSTEYAKIRP